MNFFNLLIFIFVAVNFASFIWAAFRFFHFPDEDGVQSGTKWLSYLVLSAKAMTLVAVLMADIHLDLQLLASLVVLGLSAALFWWSLRTHVQRRLSAAFSKDLPEHLVQQGPYRWIRHPFYTAYLLSYLGGFIAAPFWWALPILLVPYMVYHRASSFEEEKFAKSSLKDAYAAYRLQTGRFWPRLVSKKAAPSSAS